MLNNVILVGTIKSLPPVIKGEKNFTSDLEIEVQRPFREMNGNYLSDTFTIVLWRGDAEATMEKCQVGTMISVKGRLENTDNGVKVIAENVKMLH